MATHNTNFLFIYSYQGQPPTVNKFSTEEEFKLGLIEHVSSGFEYDSYIEYKGAYYVKNAESKEQYPKMSVSVLSDCTIETLIDILYEREFDDIPVIYLDLNNPDRFNYS